MPFPDSEYPPILRGRTTRESQRLLAAAPQMLCVLQEIKYGCEQRLLKGKDHGDLQTLRLCRAAISAAEGSGA